MENIYILIREVTKKYSFKDTEETHQSNIKAFLTITDAEEYIQRLAEEYKKPDYHYSVTKQQRQMFKIERADGTKDVYYFLEALPVEVGVAA